MKHSKSRILHQESQMQEYLTADKLTVNQKKLLFKLKTRMTPNKTNLKSKYKNDLSCTLCKNKETIEDLPHLLCCPFLTRQPELVPGMCDVKYQDVFGKLIQQVEAVKVFEKIFNIYKKENES